MKNEKKTRKELITVNKITGNQRLPLQNLGKGNDMRSQEWI